MLLSLHSLPFTSTYLGSMLLTLYAALVLQSYFLVLAFSALQGCAVAWYLVAYMPGGAPILRMLSRGVLRICSAICCRGGKLGGSGMLPL